MILAQLQHSRIAFGTCLVRISTGTPNILTDGFRYFTQSLQTNVAMVPRLCHDRFLPNPSELNIHQSLYFSMRCVVHIGGDVKWQNQNTGCYVSLNCNLSARSLNSSRTTVKKKANAIHLLTRVPQQSTNICVILQHNIIKQHNNKKSCVFASKKRTSRSEPLTTSQN